MRTTRIRTTRMRTTRFVGHVPFFSGSLFLIALSFAAFVNSSRAQQDNPDVYTLNAQLLVASRAGDEATALRLLDRGAAINSRNRGGNTALLMFAEKGNSRMVTSLLKRGADVNLPNLEKVTPLMAAVHAGHGLHYRNVRSIAAIEEIVELNIGHSIIAQSVFDGLPKAVADMKYLMLGARRS